MEHSRFYSLLLVALDEECTQLTLNYCLIAKTSFDVNVVGTEREGDEWSDDTLDNKCFQGKSGCWIFESMQIFMQLTRCSVPVNIALRSITNSMTVYSYLNPHNRRTGRGHANDLMHRDLSRFIVAKKRSFTKTIGRLVGVDSGLEKVMLMLDVGKKPKQRKLDEAKRNRLGRMFLEHVFQILCEYDRFCDIEGLELCRVDVGPTFKVMDVYWLAKGDKSDEIAEEVLKGSEDFVRKRLSESLGSHNVPRLTFIAERRHLVEQEMKFLFEKADYGMQYRALSHTGAILGSMADSGSLSGKGQQETEQNFYTKKKN